jgi:hypothetical protein
MLNCIPTLISTLTPTFSPFPTFQDNQRPLRVYDNTMDFLIIEALVVDLVGALIHSSRERGFMYFCFITCCHNPSYLINLHNLLNTKVVYII